MSSKSQYSITPIAAAISAALATPTAVLAQEEGSRSAASELEEVLVTATKIEQDVQKIPSTVQALPEAMLKEMGALNTEDYVRFMPAVTFINIANTDSAVIFRGVSTGFGGFIGTQPASVYYDEVTVSGTSQQPNIRMLDINRVEALAGPQGTLFGASAQSGTLRIITNKPDASKFEANVDTELRAGSGLDESYRVAGVLNLPLVEDVFAIRIAAETATDGGYIDNVFGHTPDSWFGYYSGGPDYTDEWGRQHQEWGTIDNARTAGKNTNKVEFLIARISALWNINDNWSALASYQYSETESQDDNAYNPFVGDLEKISFNPNWRRDRWELASLVLEGDLGFAQFTSATSFYDRTYDYSTDATLYYRYYQAWGCADRGDASTFDFDYYYWIFENTDTGRAVYYPRYCVNGGSAIGDPSVQADFTGTQEGPSFQDRFAQEFRLSHQGDTIDWLVGAYYEDSNDNWDFNWFKADGVDFQTTQALTFMEALYSNPANCTAEYVAQGFCQPGTTFPNADFVWYGEDRTQWKQKAVFGEATWHINEDWNLTVGGRFFETTNDKQILRYYAGFYDENGKGQGGILQPRSQPGSGGELTGSGKISEFVPKVALSWQVTDDKMLYATYTEGFRPGGTNRLAGNVDYTRTVFPQVWEPDLLKNYEIGAKTRWADNTLQLNVSLFYMDWVDFQVEIVDPSFGECVDISDPGPCSGAQALPWTQIIANVGDAHSAGVQAELAWIPAEGWDIGANVQLIEAEIDEDLVTRLDKKTGLPELVVDKGQRLPNVADLNASAWASYTWPVQFISGGEMFLRGQVSHTGDSVNLLIPERSSANPSHDQAAYTIADLRIGLISNAGDWRIELFVNNVTDERAELWRQTGTFEWAFSHSTEYERYHRIYTNRPREFGLRYTQQWGQ